MGQVGRRHQARARVDLLSATPKKTKKSKTESAVAASAFLALMYGLGALFLESFGWFLDLRWWWLSLMSVVFTGLIYYQTRNNLDDRQPPAAARPRRPLTGRRLRVLQVVMTLAFTLLAAGSAAAGIALLATGKNAADSGAGVFLAFVPLLLSVPVLILILAIRGDATVRTQWTLVLCGLAGLAVVLIVFGITAEDATKLVGYGIACAAAAAGVGGAAARRGRSTPTVPTGREREPDQGTPGDRS